MATATVWDLHAIEEGTGRPIDVHYTADDTAANALIAPSGATDVVLSGSRRCRVTQFVAGVAGTTTTVELFVNGTSTGKFISKVANAAGSSNPTVNLAQPILLNAGAQIRFIQRA